MAFWRHFLERMPGVLGMRDGHAFALGCTTTLPTCEARRRGEKRCIKGGAGVADREVTCRKDAADAYAWADAPLRLAILSGSTTWNPGSVPGGGRVTQTVTVTGALTTDVPVCALSSVNSDVARPLGAITAADTCECALHNTTTGTAVDYGSGTLTCLVLRYS